MCMADYADERPSVYRSHMQRTRKDRRCEECGRMIAAGELYQYVFLAYAAEGASTFATCEHCVCGISWLSKNCGGWVHGGVWEDLEEHITEYPTLARHLQRLKVGRLRQWERFDRTGLMAVPPVPPSLEDVGLEPHA